MEFGWHSGKREANLAKHLIDFGDVVPAFLDRRALTWPDDRRDYGERRFNMLARLGVHVIHVTFTRRAGVIWLISARRANRKERERYEQRSLR